MKRTSMLLVLFTIALALPAWAQEQAPKQAARIPQSILMTDAVQTRIGTMKFLEGVGKLQENLDRSRGMDAFAAGMPATSVHAVCEGLSKAGIERNQGIGITETRADTRSLRLAPNTAVVHGWACVDLKAGPMVVQVPPGVLGIIDDAYFRNVTDVGPAGPDRGKGGRYLMVPPGHKGTLARKGHIVRKPRTFGNIVIIRAVVQSGDTAAAMKNIKDGLKIHSLAAAANPPAQKFVDISGMQLKTVDANSFHFYEELNAVVQHEPAHWVEPETAGLFAAIGIEKGKPFAPEARMKAILVDAAAVGTSRAIVFAPDDPRAKAFPDRQWTTGFSKGSYTFADAAERMLDARTPFLHHGNGISPAMAAPKVGSGTAYAHAARDSQGRYLDGGKAYKVTLPASIPAGRSWSFTIYDNETRSFLETDQKLGGLDSKLAKPRTNADGSVTVWFGPKAPAGQEGNWVQTLPGRGWNTTLRLYSPLQPWFDRSWKPGDIEEVKG